MTKNEQDVFPLSRDEVLKQFVVYCEKYLSLYPQKRNFDFGSPHPFVSKLSPYLRRRLVSETEILNIAFKMFSASSLDKFIQEIFWRTYWRGWLEMRPQVYEDYLNDSSEQDTPGNTGIKCFDHWTQEIIDTGYLHNHARMWFASIWIFTLGKSWTSGANFFRKHLIDWCPASNTLGWRWVAGLQTREKVYVAKPANIKTFTCNRFFPEGQLNESPVFSTECWKDYKKTRYSPPRRYDYHSLENFGVILNDNDLTINHVIKNENKDFMTCIFHNPNPAFTKSYRVSSFEEKLITKIYSDLPNSHYCESKESILEWARTHRLNYLIFPFETVGNKYFMCKSFCDELASNNIIPIFHKRDWDRNAFSFADKGFFPFKKNIPELLSKVATDRY